MKFIDDISRLDLLHQYNAAERRLFLLDYDGSLVPFAKTPQEAAPPQDLLLMLSRLCQYDKNDVVVISGRDADTLQAWLGHLPLSLVAEHGAKTRLRGGEWMNTVQEDNTPQLRLVEEIMQQYVARCPGSFIEEKTFSRAWHYRKAETELGNATAIELTEALKTGLENLPLHVLQGNKVIEVRPAGINKGSAVASLLRQGAYEFIFCAGDDTTDEDMFVQLADMPQAFTIKIGRGPSEAKYNLLNPAMVQALLRRMAHSGAKA